MCVALYIKPYEMPTFEQIKAASIVNADGFGIVVPDRGKLELVKMFDPKGNDADIIYKTLEDTKHLPRYAHLRFATKGSKNEQNCHPFSAYKDDDYEVMFMHNGTLGEYGSNNITDSEDFAKKIVGPLVERVRYYTDAPLKDTLVFDILKKFAGPSSKFLLVDSNGSDLIIPQSESKWHDWGWSSNEYSFRESHRATGATSYGGKTYSWTPTHKKQDITTTNRTTSPGKIGSSVSTSKSADVIPWEYAPKIEKEDEEIRMTFCEMAGLKSIDEIFDIAKEDLLTLIEDKEIAWALFAELRDELYELFGNDD